MTPTPVLDLTTSLRGDFILCLYQIWVWGRGRGGGSLLPQCVVPMHVSPGGPHSVILKSGAIEWVRFGAWPASM